MPSPPRKAFGSDTAPHRLQQRNLGINHVLDTFIDSGFLRTSVLYTSWGGVKSGALTSPLPGVQFVCGNFPDDLPAAEPFDAITLLAVLEHVPEIDKPTWALACHHLLAADGCVVLTVPSPRVDAILAVLRFFRLVEGMALEEHHGFDPGEVTPLFESTGFRLVAHETFQFGLNNLFVFTKNA